MQFFAKKYMYIMIAMIAGILLALIENRKD